MRFSIVPSMFAVGLMIVLTGCDKIPTWGELTSGAKPAPVAAPAPQVVAPPVAVQVAPPAPPSSVEVIAKFNAIPPSLMTDDAVTQLTNLTEGLDQITEINADGSRVKSAAFKSINKLTNLRQLRLDGTLVDNDACKNIAQLSSLEVLALSGTRISDAGVAALSALQNLKSLELNNCQLTENGFAAIGQMSSLETLQITNTALNNQRMDLICNAKTLKNLTLSGNPIDDYGLVYLKKLPVVSYLELSGTRCTGEGLAHASKGGGLKTLIKLGMHGAPLNDFGVQAIAGCKSLQILNLWEVRGLTDQAVYIMTSALKNLKSLDVGTTQIDGTGLKGLKGCKDLEELHISHCPRIGDYIVNDLKNLKNLKVVALTGTAVTPKAIAALKFALPDLEVR